MVGSIVGDNVGLSVDGVGSLVVPVGDAVVGVNVGTRLGDFVSA